MLASELTPPTNAALLARYRAYLEEDKSLTNKLKNGCTHFEARSRRLEDLRTKLIPGVLAALQEA